MLQQELGTKEKLLETIERFRSDNVAYSTLCLRIRDKDGVLLPLIPNKPQEIVEAKLEAQRAETGRVRAIVLKARQEGVSTWTAARFFKRMNLFEGQRGLVVADELDRAGNLFGMYDRFYQHLPEDIRPQRKSFANQKRLAFTHDSELSVRSATDENAGRSFTIHCLHASELAFWADTVQRAVWTSLMQAVPGRGSEVIVESTANGAGGLFHDLWEQSQKPNSPWVGIFLPWWIMEEYEEEPTQEVLDAIESNPDDFELQAMGDGIPYEGQNWVLSLRKLAWRRFKIVENFGGDILTLGKDATRDFMQEYPATAEEAFLVSGSCYFDTDALQEMKRTHPRDPLKSGRMVETKDKDENRLLRFEKSARGYIDIYEEPDPAGHYVIGSDTATGKLVTGNRVTSDTAAAEHGGRDYSCSMVLRLGDPEKKTLPTIAAILHGGLQHDVFARQTAWLGEYYSCGGKSRVRKSTTTDPALVMVESNHSSGQRVLEYLKDILRYRRLYWQREINTRTKKFERRIGWRTDERTRIILIDTLAEMIRKGQIWVPDADTIRELTTFVVHEDGKPAAEEGTHDDRVIALCLAVQAAKEHRHAFLAPPQEWEAAPTASGL